MNTIIILMSTVLFSLTAATSFAAQVRVFVADITTVGVQSRDAMGQTLQALLASRLNGDRVLVVGNRGEADAVVSGTYVSIGKMFSIDAIATTATGKVLTRAYVQGETQDELIPAVGRLAEKLSVELNKQIFGSSPDVSLRQSPQPFVAPTAGDFIKPSAPATVATAGWLSKRLTGAANLIAVGLTLPDGSREIFLAEERRISYFRQSGDMNLVSEVELKSTEKIISLDTITGSDGVLDIYVTIIRSGEPASQVWQVRGDSLVQVAGNLPYFFRSISLSGGAKKLYAQAMGRDDDYFGDVAEATRNGSVITLKNPLKMPRYGNIYSFNQFRDQDGKVFTAVINIDGYLVVYDQHLKELWRSNDKFGGSELYFQKEDEANMRVTGDKYRWVFMNQRIQISAKGDILVGKNDGFWVLGNARSYKRGAVFCLTWNGSSLEEKWRTRDTQNYMPDFFFDDTRNELLILQTVQRSGMAERGASSLSIKKVE